MNNSAIEKENYLFVINNIVKDVSSIKNKLWLSF